MELIYSEKTININKKVFQLYLRNPVSHFTNKSEIFYVACNRLIKFMAVNMRFMLIGGDLGYVYATTKY